MLLRSLKILFRLHPVHVSGFREQFASLDQVSFLHCTRSNPCVRQRVMRRAQTACLPHSLTSGKKAADIHESTSRFVFFTRQPCCFHSQTVGTSTSWSTCLLRLPWQPSHVRWPKCSDRKSRWHTLQGRYLRCSLATHSHPGWLDHRRKAIAFSPSSLRPSSASASPDHRASSQPGSRPVRSTPCTSCPASESPS